MIAGSVMRPEGRNIPRQCQERSRLSLSELRTGVCVYEYQLRIGNLVNKEGAVGIIHSVVRAYMMVVWWLRATGVDLRVNWSWIG